jgi:hypothetical protein
MLKIDFNFPHSTRTEENRAAYYRLIASCDERPLPKGYTHLGSLNDVTFTQVALPAGVWALVLHTTEPKWNRVVFYNNKGDLQMDVPEGLTK